MAGFYRTDDNVQMFPLSYNERLTIRWPDQPMITVCTITGVLGTSSPCRDHIPSENHTLCVGNLWNTLCAKVYNVKLFWKLVLYFVDYVKFGSINPASNIFNDFGYRVVCERSCPMSTKCAGYPWALTAFSIERLDFTQKYRPEE